MELFLEIFIVRAKNARRRIVAREIKDDKNRQKGRLIVSMKQITGNKACKIQFYSLSETTIKSGVMRNDMRLETGPR